MMKIGNKLKQNKKNNERDFLDASGYWAWDPTAIEGF